MNVFLAAFKIKLIFSYFKLKPFDTETEEGRLKERYRLSSVGAATNLLSKIVMMLVMVASVKMTVSYLGVDKYGIWVTISSFAFLLNFCDLGIGNALVNRVAQVTLQSSNQKKVSDLVSGGLISLAGISLVIGFFLYIASIFIPWDKILKISDKQLHEETYGTIKAFVILFAINIFAEGINKVFYGMQRAYEANVFRILGSLLSLLLIWVVVNIGGGMSDLLVASMLGGVIANLSLIGLLVNRKQFSSKNLFRNMRAEAPFLLRTGGSFFSLQAGGIILLGVDNFIIANYLGVAMVASYSIVQKLFQLLTQPCVVINHGLWPAYANARAHRDYFFISRTLKNSICITALISFAVGSILIIFGKKIILEWTDQQIVVSLGLLISYCLWAIIDAMSNAFAMFLNGLSLLDIQTKGIVTLIFIGLPLKIYLLSEFGIEFMLAGFSLFFLANLFFWCGIVYKKTILRNY